MLRASLAMLLTAAVLAPPAAAQGVATSAAQRDVISAELRAEMASAGGTHVPAYLVMADQLTPEGIATATRGLTGRVQRRAAADALKAHAATSQAAARALLGEAVAAGAAAHVELLWMGNAIVFEATPAVIERLAQLPGVDRIRMVAAYDPSAVQDALPVAPAAPVVGGPADGAPVEPNIVQLQAEQLWSAGFTGQGVMVGNLDSGVWWQHPDLVNRMWINPGEIPGNGIDDDNNGYVDDIRGWDFLTDTPDITSFDSHGTKTSGLAVGDGSSGTRATGMAPGATLLGFELGTEPDYWLAQQYCLDKGVDVITSSYSYKWAFVPKPDYHMHRQMCVMELAAGVIHANSIGNQGTLLGSYPIPFNIAVPGNCPPPFDHPALVDGGRTSVMGCGGLLIATGQLYGASGRGPAAWEDIKLYDSGYPWPQQSAWWDYPYGGFGGVQPGLIKPDVMAYTEGVWTTTIGGGYTTFGGTSAATPHLGGALALLRSAQPHAEPRHIDAALELTAVDYGDAGKDNVYGSGKLQVFDAARRLRILGRASTQTPSIGTNVTLDVYGYPNAVAFGFFGPFLGNSPGFWNLLAPWFDLGPTPLGPSGHAALNLTIPASPVLVGITVWFQFGAAVDDPATWGPGVLTSTPEGLTIQA